MLLQLYAERMVRQQREKAELAAAERDVGLRPGATAVRRRSSVTRAASAGETPPQGHTVDDFMRAAAM